MGDVAFANNGTIYLNHTQSGLSPYPGGYRNAGERGEESVPEEFKPGCQRPKSGPVATEAATSDEQVVQGEEDKTMIKVGQKAPDFSAPAYHKGKFVEVTLSEYIGRWIVLCFYPGDFTFV